LPLILVLILAPQKIHKRSDAQNDYRVATELYLFPKKKKNIDKILKLLRDKGLKATVLGFLNSSSNQNYALRVYD
jgi:hypothetical protein